MTNILAASKQFYIESREFTFDEHDPIFFMTKPKPSAEAKNTSECNTCKKPFQKVSELKDSRCHFCGFSNCKTCLAKTRKFRSEHY